jgi:ParB family chromosome partitioning protein
MPKTVTCDTLLAMSDDIELDRLYTSHLRSIQQPLPWPNPSEVAHARETGLIEPVIVRPLPGTQPPNYEILFGLKNWLLAQRLGLVKAPVTIRTVGDEIARRWVEADSRSSRSAENPIIVARAIQRRVREGLKVAAAGRELGLSRTDASHRLRLLRLAPDILERVASGELAPGTARALVGLTLERQRRLADHIRCEGLSTRQVETLVRVWKASGIDDLSSLGTAPPSISSSFIAVKRDPDQEQLERALSEHLGTPVAIRYPASGTGQLVIDFATLEILEGILERLGYKA